MSERPTLHAVTVLLRDDGALARPLDLADCLQGAYEIAESAADELRSATQDNDLAAHRLLIRAHFITYLHAVGIKTACDLLRDLILEARPGEGATGDPTDWATVTLK